MKVKDVCERCHGSRFGYVRAHAAIWRLPESEARMWEAMEVYCPAVNWILNTTDDPPRKCPYLLEHLLGST